MTPIPYGEYLTPNVSEDDSSIDFGIAILTAEFYGITEKETENIVKELTTTFKENRERLAAMYGLNCGNIEKMRTAFSACYG